MKPSWDEAPSWAKFLAMDQDCEWWWHEDEPNAGHSMWSQPGGRAVIAGFHDWKETKEPRP